MVASTKPIVYHWISKLARHVIFCGWCYLGEGENIGTRRGVVELLELVVILLF